MSDAKYAPARDDGMKPYVVTTYSWGQSYDRIEWAHNLRDAKAQHGWTRQLHTSKTVRRATTTDVTPEEPPADHGDGSDAGGAA